MRPVFESNELKPMVTTSFVDDPIAFWKKESADGTGRDVLAAMLNVLSTGYVRVGPRQGRDLHLALFRRDRSCQADARRRRSSSTASSRPQLALPMKKSGKYSYYRLGVSPTGVWQYFLQ